MAFVSIDDVNAQLPEDKIEVDSAQFPPIELDAERVVRGYLAGYIPALTIASWASPEATPELIVAITARLCAAFWYRERYSEDSLVDPQYALEKYNEAIGWLNAIRAGTMFVIDPDNNPVEVDSGLNIDEVDFWPNDTTPGPYFTMDMNF